MKFATQRKISFTIGKIQNAAETFGTLFPILSNLLIFYVMISAQSKGGPQGPTLTTGDFIAFTSAYGLFMSAMQSLGDASLSMLRIVPVYERFKPILDCKPEVDRSKGCGEALKGYPDIKVVGELWSEGWHQDEGFKLTQDLLQAHPDVSIVIGQADALALGAAQAVKVANPGHKVWVAGFDGDVAALKALKDGVFDVTATQQTQGMGRLAVDAAIKLVAGEKVPAEDLQDATLTTKDNVEQFIAKHP